MKTLDKDNYHEIIKCVYLRLTTVKRKQHECLKKDYKYLHDTPNNIITVSWSRRMT